MTHLLNWLLHIDSPDPEVQRRGKILVTLSSGIVAVLLTVGLTLTLFQPTVGRLVNLTLAVLVFGTAAVLGKKRVGNGWRLRLDHSDRSRCDKWCIS